ncbi:hypothetical protein SAMN02745181_0274 [Rubritalea squalenifaciens DSM 18772]|uniref:Uncharacterized protein n=1 Tax=Rubritalea squalenifaciens DSM 18772 TaxID=1123071 RepID=A0A1M6BP36_9BACT|nr:hypothetical protein [Rubritalea squalenifaciens]SHI50521.1 hypothetical protein SAMN02745181_0274 [Rubritalea squalenifaciens DSM 18772]
MMMEKIAALVLMCGLWHGSLHAKEMVFETGAIEVTYLDDIEAGGNRSETDADDNVIYTAFEVQYRDYCFVVSGGVAYVNRRSVAKMEEIKTLEFSKDMVKINGKPAKPAEKAIPFIPRKYLGNHTDTVAGVSFVLTDPISGGSFRDTTEDGTVVIGLADVIFFIKDGKFSCLGKTYPLPVSGSQVSVKGEQVTITPPAKTKE